MTPRSDCTNASRSAGLAFVVCFAVAAALYGSGAGSTQASVTGYYTHHGGRQIAGFAVLLAGCALLLVYTTTATRSPIGRASGLAATVLLAAGNALWAATAFAVELEPGYLPSVSSHLLLEDAAWIVIVSASALAIPFVAVVSWERGSRWLRALGGAAILGLAAAYWYVPLAAFLAWIVAESLNAAAASRAARSARTPS